MRVALCGVLAASISALTAPLAVADTQGAPVVTVTGQAAGSSLEARVTKLERVLDGQALADLLTRIQRLQEDVQKLRGDLEVQGNDINGIKQRQRDLYLDIDRRLQQLESAAANAKLAPATSQPPLTAPPLAGVAPGAGAPMPAMSPGMAPAAAPPPAMASVTPASPPANPDQEQTAYQKAFNLLKDGHYDDAIAAFHDMLSAYPGGKLADNAQYWIGEAHFAARRFREAADEFSKVINNYPQSPKVPDAMLKLGFSYYELADWAKARDTLEQLKGRYPQSTAAQLADRRLQKMKSEGH
jgi:tol-pal system protein YbgF